VADVHRRIAHALEAAEDPGRAEQQLTDLEAEAKRVAARRPKLEELAARARQEALAGLRRALVPGYERALREAEEQFRIDCEAFLAAVCGPMLQLLASQARRNALLDRAALIAAFATLPAE